MFNRANQRPSLAAAATELHAASASRLQACLRTAVVFLLMMSITSLFSPAGQITATAMPSSAIGVGAVGGGGDQLVDIGDLLAVAGGSPSQGMASRRPDNFKTLEELNQYLAEMRQYYSLLGRPRFGRSVDRWRHERSSSDSNVDSRSSVVEDSAKRTMT